MNDGDLWNRVIEVGSKGGGMNSSVVLDEQRIIGIRVPMPGCGRSMCGPTACQTRKKDGRCPSIFFSPSLWKRLAAPVESGNQNAFAPPMMNEGSIYKRACSTYFRPASEQGRRDVL